MIRLLHSSDLHLGKPFGRFPEEVRGRLRQARQDAIGALARAARDGGAATVLLAGDTFDAETPATRTVRQALNAMAAASDLTWVLLPGNHDSLAATELWRALAADLPANVILATDPRPLELAGAAILPAPCTARRPGRDLTDTLDQPTAEGLPRIGLAHGGVTDFGQGTAEEGEPAVIPPDRAERSGLDYLALGDWHGQVRVGPRLWYSGSPEHDGFKHPGRGAALLVAVAPGGVPEVTPVQVGTFDWLALDRDLLPGDDAAADLAADLAVRLPDVAARADTLLRLTPRGRLGLAARAALIAGFDRVAPDFLWAEARLGALDTVQEAADLDLIGAGALRRAADILAAEAANPAADHATAAAALRHLFDFATAEEDGA